MRLLSVDAGKKKQGWAAYQDLVLQDAGYSAALPFMTGVDYVVVELPQIYQRKKQKGDQNDLIRIAAEAGLAAGCIGAPVLFFLPREWKGLVSKEISHDRAKRFFEERSCRISLSIWAEIYNRFNKTERHNVLDAVAFGQWAARKGPRIEHIARMHR